MGRLCNSETDLFHKDLFLNFIAEYYLGYSNICNVTKSLIETLLRYDLIEYLNQYVSTGNFPRKNNWKNIVINAITRREEDEWTLCVNSRSELSRFMSIQKSQLKPNNLLLLSYIFPEHRDDLINLLKIAASPIMKSHCDMCGIESDDIILHLFMSCQSYIQERDSLYDIIVNILPVEFSVSFFEQDDYDILKSILGGLTSWTLTITDDVWIELMLNISEYSNS